MIRPVLELTPEESAEYVGLPRDVILSRYIKAHKDDRCPHCGWLIGNHSVKKLSKCADHDGLIISLPEIEPEEVEMVQCPKCLQVVPPAFACIRCGEKLSKIIVE